VTYYILGSIAGIAIGAVMLRSAVFSNLAGWMAILGNGVGLGLYVPTIGVYISVFSVLFLEVWDGCSSRGSAPPGWRCLDEGGQPVRVGLRTI
jgi:hypothetical protein